MRPKKEKILLESISVINSPFLENQITRETPKRGIKVINEGWKILVKLKNKNEKKINIIPKLGHTKFNIEFCFWISSWLFNLK